MRKYIILILLFEVLCIKSSAQREKDSIRFPKQACFIEVLGTGEALMSANYERKLLNIGTWCILNWRVGVGYDPGDSVRNEYQKSAWTFPLAVSSYIGHKNHFLTIGVANTFVLSHKFIDSTTTPPSISKSFESIFSIKLGYRYYNYRSGLFIEVYPMRQFVLLGYPTELSRFLFGFSIGAIINPRKKH
jgi:hypothetical protein